MTIHRTTTRASRRVAPFTCLIASLLAGAVSADLAAQTSPPPQLLFPVTGVPAAAAAWDLREKAADPAIVRSEFVRVDASALLRLSGKRLQKTVLPHSGNVVSFAAQVPNDTSLCGLRVYAQGVIVGSPGVQLSNRLDLVLGL